ncbi:MULTISPECIES: glutaredoxin family protein [unclassified Synechococcus]|uniref:glutaredoxin family protein n=1 Tax=unclassified Synechococcus TaxID=2626047 RepID=UPI0006526EF5|nr:glutaredoxin family protein [Synechococcus sp. WH 8020]AKN59840.1 thioredoxin [Synechococcus sp. WH 8020]
MTPSPIDSRRLLLYSRAGCCLCEGLEQRLRDLNLEDDIHPLTLVVVDIDAPDCAASLRARFDLEVPVLVLGDTELPRVSPRLSGDGLRTWLQRVCAPAAGSD